MKKRKVLLILTGVFFVFLFILPALASASPLSNSTRDASSEDIIQIDIYGATYGDFDGDSVEDDVECYVTVTFHQGINRKKFDIYAYLELPNDDLYAYGIMVNTFRFQMTFHLIFYNHAYVSGDYTITVHLILAQKGNYYGYASVIFDPPREEEPDSDPIFECSLV
ncbi:MAG: hypothetical protein ACTSQE_03785 [Candidatus Heimdallarchaeaceae archaeon]